MQGNLDQPPLLVRRSRFKALVMVVGGFAAIIGGAVALADSSGHSIWPAGSLLFGIALLFYLTEVIWPDTLVLSPLGLRFEGIWRNWSYRWEEVHRFRILALSGGAKAISFDVRPRHNSILDGVARGATGRSGTLNGLWELGPEKLVALLNEAQSRWAEDVSGRH